MESCHPHQGDVLGCIEWVSAFDQYDAYQRSGNSQCCESLEAIWMCIWPNNDLRYPADESVSVLSLPWQVLCQPPILEGWKSWYRVCATADPPPTALHAPSSVLFLPNWCFVHQPWKRPWLGSRKEEALYTQLQQKNFFVCCLKTL